MRLTRSLVVLAAALALSGCSGTEAETDPGASTPWPFDAAAAFDEPGRDHLGALQRAAVDAATARTAAAAGQQAAEDGALAAAAQAAAAAAAAAQAAAEAAADEECIGYGCSPEQDAEINAAERAANDYGPGCNYMLCGETDEYPSFACDAGEDGLPVCEGDVPASVGTYRTPDGSLVGG